MTPEDRQDATDIPTQPPQPAPADDSPSPTTYFPAALQPIVTDSPTVPGTPADA